MLSTAAYLILLLGQSLKYSAKIPASKDVQFFLDVLFQYREPQMSMGGYVYTFFLVLFCFLFKGKACLGKSGLKALQGISGDCCNLPWELASLARDFLFLFFFRLGNLGDQSV